MYLLLLCQTGLCARIITGPGYKYATKSVVRDSAVEITKQRMKLGYSIPIDKLGYCTQYSTIKLNFCDTLQPLSILYSSPKSENNRKWYVASRLGDVRETHEKNITKSSQPQAAMKMRMTTVIMMMMMMMMREEKQRGDQCQKRKEN